MEKKSSNPVSDHHTFMGYDSALNESFDNRQSYPLSIKSPAVPYRNNATEESLNEHSSKQSIKINKYGTMKSEDVDEDEAAPYVQGMPIYITSRKN